MAISNDSDEDIQGMMEEAKHLGDVFSDNPQYGGLFVAELLSELLRLRSIVRMCGGTI